MKQCQLIKDSRKQWSSEPAFVFSMTAAAVGLGNLWRFPYILGENGGGAFVIAYLLALFIIVLPMMMLEVAAGRMAQSSIVHTYRQVNRFGTVYGWFVVLVTTAITSYYLVITGIGGEPVLDVIDRIAGTNVIIISGILGAALFTWFIPPDKVRAALGVRSRWWEWRIYLVGRYLPLALVAWLLLTLIL